MEFWNKTVNVSEEAARLQIGIIKQFPSKKRMKIALDFCNMGVSQTRAWIKKNNPQYSELEISLAFVKIMYHENGEMDKNTWLHYQKVMREKIKEDWINRFRKMMKENNWTYKELAAMGGFKNAAVVKSTISRGLPSFAKLAVKIHEEANSKR